MATKKYKVGSLIKTEIETQVKGQKVKKTLLSIGLGSKNPKKPEWDQTVELIVRDAKGKVLHQQKDGYLEVVDPRKEHEDLFAAGFIDEEQAMKMKENAAKLSDKVRYVLKAKAVS